MYKFKIKFYQFLQIRSYPICVFGNSQYVDIIGKTLLIHVHVYFAGMFFSISSYSVVC